MIVKNIFNFEVNLNKLGSYRTSLKNLKDTDLVRSLQKYESRRYDKNRIFLEATKFKIVDSINFENSYKDMSSYFFLQNKNSKQFDRLEEDFFSRTYTFIKNSNKEIIKVDDLIKASELTLNSFYNKAIVRSFFEEKTRELDAVDYKTEKVFSRHNKCFVKNGTIENPLVNNLTLDIVSIEVDKAQSTFSNQSKALKVDQNTSKIHRPKMVWNYIVGVRDFNEDGQIQKHESAKLVLIVNTDGFNEANHLYIESGSCLPIEFIEGNLEYWDGSSWNLVGSPKELSLFNRKFVSFDTVYTNKFRLTFNQKSYIDLENIKNTEMDEELIKEFINSSFLDANIQEESSEFKRIYDLSLRELTISHKQNSGLGFYNDFNKVYVSGMLSCYLDFSYLREDNNSYVEKYLKLDLYGGSDYEAIENKSNSNTKRIELIIPIPSNNYIETELLVLKNSEAKINLFPKTDLNAITVYKDNVALTVGSDYLISLDGGVSYSETVSSNTKPYAGNFYIKILNKTFSEYKVSYELNDSIYFIENNDLVIQNGKVVFKNKLKKAKGFIEALFIIRNKNINNLSSSIKSFKYLIEEDSQTELEILNEDIKIAQRAYRGTLNVV